MKYSISICSNSRERKMKLRGVISLRNALPICAMPNGTFARATCCTFLKLTKMPCAVSGRRNAFADASAIAPTLVSNMRLNARGGVSVGLPVAGLGTLASVASSASATHSSTRGSGASSSFAGGSSPASAAAALRSLLSAFTRAFAALVASASVSAPSSTVTQPSGSPSAPATRAKKSWSAR